MSLAPDFSLGTVDVALTPAERFAEFLRTRGKRITRQRRVIVDHVASRHEHFDADQLLADLRKTPEGAKASRPTVYRTLAEMVDAGLLNKMVLDGRAVYEHDYGYPPRPPLLHQLPPADRVLERRGDADLRRRRHEPPVPGAVAPPDRLGPVPRVPQQQEPDAASGPRVRGRRGVPGR
jgi:Fur family ferric uptake transcriptional regulator